MDFVKALTYPFDDEDWLKKLGIAVLLVFLNLIPVIGTFIMIFAISGWQFEIIKRVKRNDPEPLPGWDNFGALISKGLTLVLASLVYQIPTLLLSCIAFVPFGLMPMMGAFPKYDLRSDGHPKAPCRAVFMRGSGRVHSHFVISRIR